MIKKVTNRNVFANLCILEVNVSIMFHLLFWLVQNGKSLLGLPFYFGLLIGSVSVFVVFLVADLNEILVFNDRLNVSVFVIIGFEGIHPSMIVA